MTLRTTLGPDSSQLNRTYSDLIFLQRKEKPAIMDLSSNTPLIHVLHPKMVRELLAYLENPDEVMPVIPLEGPYYHCYESIVAANRDFPLPAQRGFPYAMSIFLSDKRQTMLDFGPLGTVILSRSPLPQRSPQTLQNRLMHTLLAYAMSQELWGPEGKWPRFHARIHAQLEKSGLLKGPDLPGRYPLIIQAKKIEKFGIKGELADDHYILTLPWTFSATELKKLEEIIVQEF